MSKNTQFDAVEEFNKKFGHDVRDVPSLDYDDLELRLAIHLEETKELEDAYKAFMEAKHAYFFGEDWPNREVYLERMDEAETEFLDALADSLVTLYGLAQGSGMPITEAFDIVHESNMSKLGEDGKPVYFTDGQKKGKIGKGPNYIPPTEKLKRLLEEKYV